MSQSNISELISKLSSKNELERNRAGTELLREGHAAIPFMLRAIESGPPEVRKAIAFLLGGTGGSPRVCQALAAALNDEEPKVRKNSAIALGRVGGQSAVEPLVRALDREQISWVRPSLVLALGKVGGTEAYAAIAAIAPRSEAEVEAIRKALDRSVRKTSVVSWREEAESLLDVFALVPAGLEDVAIAEAVDAGLPKPSRFESGILRFPRGTQPGGLMSRMRCVYSLRVLLSTGSSLIGISEENMDALLAELLKGIDALPSWSRWIKSEEPRLRYRFSLDGIRVRKVTFNSILATVRSILCEMGLDDSPSNYSVELSIEVTATGTRVWLAPAFETDPRFAYRTADVGASISPVVAACLARLARVASDSIVVDPTAGSATLLIERALLDQAVELHGMDVSPTAVRAATANVKAAGLSGRISIAQSDATDPGAWRRCHEVVANLPFGIRTKRHDRNLRNLYAGIVKNIDRFLLPDGRALLYTVNLATMRSCLAKLPAGINVSRERFVEAGGMRVGLWEIVRRPVTSERRREES